MARRFFEFLVAAGVDMKGLAGCIYTPTVGIEYRGEASSSAKSWFEEMLRTRQDHDCFHLTCDGISLFADTIPIDGIELQAGLVVAEETWSMLEPILGYIVCSTSEIPLSEVVARRVLQDLCKVLDVGTVDPG